MLGDLARAAGRPEPALDTALAAVGLPTGVVNGVVTLEHVWRFDGTIAAFAQAVQAGDADAALALLHRGADDLTLDPPDALAGAAGRRRSGRVRARRGRRGGTTPTRRWPRWSSTACCARTGAGRSAWPASARRSTVGSRTTRAADPWYPGRAVLVTANDYDTGLFNGDTGVVVATADGPRVAFARGGPPTFYPPSRLGEVAGVHVMTVHRAQGSQVRRVAVVLPPPESPLLTRELLYTAVTRAREHVRILGTPESVRAAVERPVARASGL